MQIQKFEDLKVWQKAQYLAVSIYKNTCPERDFGFTDQIRRAAISISNNVAEGFDRASNKDFARFLVIAKGSVYEVRSMVYIGRQLEYFSEEHSLEYFQITPDLDKMIWALIKHIKKKS